MSNPVGGIGSVGPAIRPPSLQLAPTASAEDGFGAVLGRVLNDVSQSQTDAEGVIGAFLRGEPTEMHRVMAATEEASISLELLVEIRNKLTDAYRSIMNMQA
jgi:flagellar hook-basal body complex protein FliE